MDSEREAQHSRSNPEGNGSITSDPKAVPSDDMVSQPPNMSSSVGSPFSLDFPSGEFIQLDPDLIFECASVSLPDVSYNSVSSEASSKSEQHDSGCSTVGTSPVSSDFTHEPAVLLRKPLTQSPPVQVMERSAATSYNPNRIPSCVFESSKSPSSLAWSDASNESLFSIQIGNNANYSREHVLKFLHKSGELRDSVGQSYKSIETTSSSPSNLAIQQGRECDRKYMNTKIKFNESVAGGADRKIDDEDADQVLGASIADQSKEDRLAQEPSVAQNSYQSASKRKSSVVSKRSNKHTSSSCHYCSCSCGSSCCSSCCKWPRCGCCTPGSCNCCTTWPSFSCCKCTSCKPRCGRGTPGSCNCCTTWPSFSCCKCTSCKPRCGCCTPGSCSCCTTWPSFSCCKCTSCKPRCGCCTPGSCNCCTTWPSFSCCKCTSCNSLCPRCGCCTPGSCNCCTTTWPSFSCCKCTSCNSFGNCLSCDSCKCTNCCRWPSCSCCEWPSCNCFKWPRCSFWTCSGCSCSLWPSCCCNCFSRPSCCSSHCWKYFCCSWSSMWETISCCYSKKKEGSSMAWSLCLFDHPKVHMQQ